MLLGRLGTRLEGKDGSVRPFFAPLLPPLERLFPALCRATDPTVRSSFFARRAESGSVPIKAEVKAT